MKQMLDFLIRPSRRLSDVWFLCLAFLVGGGAGSVLWMKITMAVGLPFIFFATLVLHLTWRAPISDT